MGLKFYRSSNKARKIRKRFTNTRTLFSTHKWVAYFAHPGMVPGHPLKGGMLPMSKGLLLNPEIKRFALASPLFFKPVRPGAGVGDQAVERSFAESPNALVQAYLGKSTISNREKCASYFSNLQKCFNSNTKNNRDPEVHCQFYVQGLKRELCAS